MRVLDRWVDEGPPALRARYRAHRDGLLLTRIRWSAMLGLFGVALGCLQYAAVTPAGRARFLAFQATFVAGCGLAWWLSRLRTMHDRAAGLALAVLIGAATHMTVCFRVLDQDRGATAAGFVGLALGTATLFPWGVAPQAVIGILSVLGYGVACGWRVGASNVFDFALVVNAVCVSLVGAWLVDHYRFTSFRESWQREHLLAFGRELAGQVELEQVTRSILEHGMTLLDADGSAIALYDTQRSLYRIADVAGQRRGGRRWLIGLEFPEGMPEAAQLLGEHLVEAPTDDPTRPVLQPLRDLGIQRVLMVVMRHGAEVVGVLCFVRRHALPFREPERLLARGVADQAALALRTARVVADLRAANRARADFVSTMSHELRTPLNVIVGYAQMARDGIGGPEGRDETLARIEAAGRDLLGLIEGTLDIGRMEAGRDAAQLERVELAAFWREVGNECARMLRRPAVAFEWIEPVPALAFTTDPRKLRVVLRNLVGNALKFTEAGRVRGEAFVEGDVLRLRISDTGIGIRPEDHEIVFEMFRQADGSDSRRFGGTGLGLYIVRRFVQQLGGTVQLESTPGCGATFTLAFPGIGAARGGTVCAA